MKKLHTSVQEEAAKLNSEDTTTAKHWKIGEFCLVSLLDKKVHGEKTFYRGEVYKKEQEGEHEVFLLDQGMVIIVEDKNLLPLPNILNAPQTAIRMHMAGAEPTGNSKNWSLSAIDKFNGAMGQFKMTFVSVVDEKNEFENSFPVIVWGVVEEVLPFSEQKQFHNISFFLHNEGLIKNSLMKDPDRLLKRERVVRDEEFGFYDTSTGGPTPLLGYETADIEETDKVTVGSLFMSVTPQVVKSWLPAKAAALRQFHGFVADFDENGIISIRSKDQQSVFKAMTNEITRIYSDTNREDSFIELKQGDTVIAQNFLNASKLEICRDHGDHLILIYL